MKAEFYDVKSKKSVEVEVKFKKKTDKGRCMIYGETDDGRKMPKFIKAEEFDTTYASVPVEGAAPKAPAKKAAAKGGCKKAAAKK